MPANAAQEQTRGLGDLPADISPGAREVSFLTAIARAHEKTLPQVRQALEKLEALSDWSGRFLVADKADYNWETAPWVHYDSFADFYQRECAPVWGSWSELHAGVITDLRLAQRARDV